MPVITSTNSNTVSGSIAARRGSLFQNHGRFYNAYQKVKETSARSRAFVSNRTNVARSYLDAGPDLGLKRAYNKVFSGAGHRMGKRWMREAVGLHSLSRADRATALSAGKQVGSNIFGRVLGAGFTAFSAYEGYKKEGVWGAAKGGAVAIGEQYLFGRLIGGVGPIGLAAGAGIGIAYGAYKAGRMINESVASYRKGYEGVQMGGQGVDDPFGMNATMRQRSLLAIQNSRLNARSGLGMEAASTYRPWNR